MALKVKGQIILEVGATMVLSSWCLFFLVLRVCCCGACFVARLCSSEFQLELGARVTPDRPPSVRRVEREAKENKRKEKREKGGWDEIAKRV